MSGLLLATDFVEKLDLRALRGLNWLFYSHADVVKPLI
jgi:hypothetical protein